MLYVFSLISGKRLIWLTKTYCLINWSVMVYGGMLISFFMSYLTNRRQYTLVNSSNQILVMWILVYHRDRFWNLCCFCCIFINDIKHAIEWDNVKLFADDTFLFKNDRNIDAVKEKASNLVEKKFRWCVANQSSINSEKTNVVLFHAKNKSIPENVDCIQTSFITLNRVRCVQYLGLMIDENLYWHMHVEHVYKSLVKNFGIFNHVKTIMS